MKRRGGFTLVELLIVIMIIAILAGMMLLATGSATDSAEATKVINDLRGAKSAALLYYADYMQWPSAAASNVTTSLEPYMDRSFDNARYTSVETTAELADGRQLIGFSALANQAGGAGVRAKLTSKARESGLMTSAYAQYSGGNDIYMNMK